MVEVEQCEQDLPDIEDISKQKWEILLDRFTRDMDPWNIDIGKLADRYRNYIKKGEKFDFELPARVILICSILLRMKVNFLTGDVPPEQEEEVEEIEEEFEEEFDEFEEEDEEPDLFVPDMQLPVRRKSKRKVTLDELKGALEKAIKIEERREQRSEERNDDVGFEINKESISNRLNRLMGKLKSLYSNSKDKIKFDEVLEKKDKKEKIEKFIQVLHLENDEKIKCVQPEFLGELLIELEKELEEENN